MREKCVRHRELACCWTKPSNEGHLVTLDAHQIVHVNMFDFFSQINTLLNFGYRSPNGGKRNIS